MAGNGIAFAAPNCSPSVHPAPTRPAVSTFFSPLRQPDSDSMRRIGTFDNEISARRFADYLYTLAIETRMDGPAADESSAAAEWDLWIRDESRVAEARQEYTQFVADPDAKRFEVQGEAARLRDQRIARESARIAERNSQLDPSLRQGETLHSARDEAARAATAPIGSQPGDRIRQKSIPITIGLIVVSVIVSVATNFGSPRGSARPGVMTLEQKIYRHWSFVDRTEFAETKGDAFASIRRGQVWRLVTPLFLHGDEFHLAFNMLWIFFLGSTIERLHGSWFFAALVLLTQIGGMMLQVSLPPVDWLPPSLHGTPFAIGASGAVYGLFGFLWIRPIIDSEYPIHMDSTNVVLMLGWLVVCITPLIPGVANGAHIGGLVAGMIAAAASYFVGGKFNETVIGR